ncbi:thioredoxin-like 3-3 [Olea europaea subsp. europaea]|uniref:Thioredoxin-like 3-3 n=1 Tax=Olea europaea subsp. europaea TaxID=158383 RepID=A0A8S0UJT1_OLEEU|nr:thioredoxin-like 3-3 [Olea europaea subsp. europaea]
MQMLALTATKGVVSGPESVEKDENTNEGKRKKGVEESKSHPGTLITAACDDNLKEIFHQIRTSKIPILPALCQLNKKFPKLSFVYADIDECPETTQRIRCSPTFHFYRDGERVDEMFGAGEERVHDRMWLQC